MVTAYYLNPKRWHCSYVFLNRFAENDYLAKSTTFKLYDSDQLQNSAKLVGLGVLNYWTRRHDPDIYHLNETHAYLVCFICTTNTMM